MRALEVMEAARLRLNDLGGDRPTPLGRYAAWQADSAPCLWKNDELHIFFRETIREIGRRCPVIDSQWLLPLVSGERLFEIAPVIAVESVTRASDGEPLLKATVAEMQYVTRWHRLGRETLSTHYRLDANGVDWKHLMGLPTHYLLDEQQGYLSVYPVLESGKSEVLQMRVSRGYPDPPAWASLALETSPTLILQEVPDVYFDALVAGICARAYKKRDSDTFSQRLSAECEEEFSRIVGPQRTATDLAMRARWAGVGDLIPSGRFVN